MLEEYQIGREVHNVCPGTDAGPISDALKLLNAVNNESGEVKLDLHKKLGSTLEAAPTFLGNTSTQTSNLRWLKLLEDINKDSVTSQALMLFGHEANEFMSNATEY